jgi:KDO2-lipid IV(A) lauroyltransferase
MARSKAVTVAHRVEYAAVRTVFGALNALPPRAAEALGGALGHAAHAPFGLRRRVVERQLAAAFPALDAAAVRALAAAAYAHLGRSAAELARLATLPAGAVLERFAPPEGWEVYEGAMAEGKGVLIATGHIGNWELAGAFLAARGVPVDPVARPQGNPLFDAYINRTRTRLGMRVIDENDAVRAIPRALREGRAVGLLSDQGVMGLASTYVPFFGRPAKTPRGPATFALRLRVPLLFGAATRASDGRHVFRFERVPVIDTGDRERDTDAIVAAYTAILERWVRRWPEQYFWHHRRWRRQPPDTPPALRDPTA